MKKFIQNLLLITGLFVLFCGSAVAEQLDKDWYLALRLGYQPYTMKAEGTIGNRDFSGDADLKDIIDKTDTTIFGGEIEYGKGKWFLNFAGMYQESEVDKGDTTTGAKVTFEEMAVNPMVGYRVYQASLSGDRAVTVDVMGGIYYVKVDLDVDIYSPVLGNFSRGGDFDFTDPMVGARTYLALTKKFGIGAMGEIGGFGVGSELNGFVAGNLVYNFSECFAVSGGYKYWYWKYEDDNALVSRYEQTIHGPVVGVQFKY